VLTKNNRDYKKKYASVERSLTKETKQKVDSTPKGDPLTEVMTTNPKAMGKYTKVLQDAQKKGGNAAAATHFLMMQKDDDYRRQFEAASGRDRDNE